MTTVSSGSMRKFVRFVLLLLGALTALASPAGAEGQNTLESSNPAAGETVTLAPTQLQLRFAQPVGGADAVAQMGLVLTCESKITNLGPPQLATDGLTVSAALTQVPENGTCEVQWQLPDGSQGSFSFISATQPTTTTIAPGDTVPPPTIPGVPGPETASEPRLGGPIGLMRWLVYIGVSALFGGIVFLKVAWPEGVEYGVTERYFRIVSLATIAAMVVHIALVVSRGSGAGILPSFIPTNWGELLNSTDGRALFIRFAAVCGLAWFVWITERVFEETYVAMSTILLILSVVTYGFDRASGRYVVLGVGLTMLHVAATSFWVGSALLVWRVILHGPGEEDLVHALRGWSRIATPLTIVVVASGAALTWRLDGLSLINSGHGRLVIVKVLITAMLIFVSAAVRQFIMRALARAKALNERAVLRLKRPVGIELSLSFLVLAASSWLVSMRPPYILPTYDGPTVDYAIVNDMVGDDDFHVTLSVTPGNVGANQVLVELFGPERVQNFVITFTPTNPDFPGYTFYVPLTRRGAALIGPEAGLKLNAPGQWNVSVKAVSTIGDLPELTSSFVIADGVTVTTVARSGSSPTTLAPGTTLPDATTLAPGTTAATDTTVAPSG